MATVIIKDPQDDSLDNHIKINPFTDIDATYSWTGSNLTQVVLTGLGYMKTITFSWTGSVLDSMAVTVTKT
jgi:hypothetical protein